MLRIESFFRAALTLPIVIPALLLVATHHSVADVFWLSLWFGGGPYLLFALPTFYWLRMPREREKMLVVLWLSPVVFTIVMVVGWLAYSIYGRFTNPNLVFDPASMLPIVVFSLLLGYGYVLVTRTLLTVLERFGCIQGKPESGLAP